MSARGVRRCAPRGRNWRLRTTAKISETEPKRGPAGGFGETGLLHQGRMFMMPQSVSARALLRAGTLAAAFAVALPAMAQQPAAPLPKPGTPGAPNQPLYGRPDNEAAIKLAPVPAPPIAARVDKLPVDKLKLPKGFNIEVYASGIPDARSLRLGDKGTVFVGNRRAGQGLCDRREGRQAHRQGDRLRTLSAERPRLPQRHALHRRTVQDLEDRQDRGQSRQPAEADADLRQSAEGRGARLEIHRASGRTTSSTSRSASPATTAFRPMRTVRSAG